jgi:hypothetical protein
MTERVSNVTRVPDFGSETLFRNFARDSVRPQRHGNHVTTIAPLHHVVEKMAPTPATKIQSGRAELFPENYSYWNSIYVTSPLPE